MARKRLITAAVLKEAREDAAKFNPLSLSLSYPNAPQREIYELLHDDGWEIVTLRSDVNGVIPTHNCFPEECVECVAAARKKAAAKSGESCDTSPVVFLRRRIVEDVVAS